MIADVEKVWITFRVEKPPGSTDNLGEKILTRVVDKLVCNPLGLLFYIVLALLF
jgi:hypothetical protein